MIIKYHGQLCDITTTLEDEERDFDIFDDNIENNSINLEDTISFSQGELEDTIEISKADIELIKKGGQNE